MKILVGIALAFMAAALPQQQRDAVRDLRNPTPAPTGTSAIRGMVVSDASGGAIRLAHVVAIGALTGTLRITTTDAEGRFAFATLPADRYLVAASKAPYLGAIAGARRPARPGASVVVATGQTLEGVSIRLPMGAAISGTITGDRGQPPGRIEVGLQQWRNQGGDRMLTMTRVISVNPEDGGRYRFYGLPPGEYVVVANWTDPTRTGRPLAAADVDAAFKGTPPTVEPTPPSAAPPVYYPGTLRAADSAPIVVAAGDDRQGVDFRFENALPGRIEGNVATTDGATTTGVTVEFSTSPRSPTARFASLGIGPDGNFGIGGMAPGSYLVIARGRGPTANQFAAATVEVFGRDVARVALTMKPALTLTGRLAFEGASAPAVNGRRVPIQALTSNTGNISASITDAAGAFTVQTVLPGRYLIGGPLSFGASLDSVTWTLQSVIVDGKDFTDLPLDIVDTAPKEIVVTYGDRSQELSGRLLTPSGSNASDFVVVAFPANKAYWIAGSRRIVTARPGTNGEFVLSAPGLVTLPPGNYLIAAVTDIDRNEQYDPAFLATLVASAVPVTLTPGAKTVQNLQIR